MAYSSKEHHDPGFGCHLELGVTVAPPGYPETVVKALGRGCIDPYTIESGGKNHGAQAGGYDAGDVYGTLGRFRDTHHFVEVTPQLPLNRLAPELGALMAAEVEQDTASILDGFADQGLRDAEVAATFDAAAEQIVPRFDEA